jgi:hypothetical protein
MTPKWTTLFFTAFIKSVVGGLPSLAGGPLVPLQSRDDSRTIIVNPDTGRMFVPGETSTNRTIYSVVGFSCAVLLSLFLGMCMVVVVLSSKVELKSVRISKSKWVITMDEIWFTNCRQAFEQKHLKTTRFENATSHPFLYSCSTSLV